VAPRWWRAGSASSRRRCSVTFSKRFSGRGRAAILAFVAGISCGHLVDPPLPPDAALLVPPPVYAGWWAMVEECSGLQGSLGDIQWYAVPRQLWNPANNNDRVEGYWSQASNRIVLNSDHTIDGGVVRHEMLHALVRAGGHSRKAFLQDCGGVVSCPPQCVGDAGAAVTPDPATPRVSPSALEVTSSVSPASPGSAIDGGLARFTISAHNPFPYPIVVVLPNPPGLGLPKTYSYDIEQIGGIGLSTGDLAVDNGGTYFAPGETKRDVFDFVVAPIPAPAYGVVAG
jgi:hypothetical protein